MNDICKIPKKSQFLYGNGGSTSIIVITPDKKVYKYFILVKDLLFNNKQEIKKNMIRDKREIKILKLLTHLKELTPHIVELYNYAYCTKIPKNLFANCDDYYNYLLSKKQTDLNCKFIYNRFPSKLNDGVLVANIEYCESSLSNELKIIIKKSIKHIKNFLDRILFQIFYSLEIIKETYPLFMHNDLFIRNILVNNISNENKFIRYKINNKYYDLSASGVIIKINDFGFTYIDKEINKSKGLVCQHNDWFNIIYDIYNGNNLGSNSLLSLTKNEEKKSFIKKYFNNFINIKFIDKIIKNNKKLELDWKWKISCDDKLGKTLLVKNTKEIFDYFDDVFSASMDHNIIKIYNI